MAAPLQPAQYALMIDLDYERHLNGAKRLPPRTDRCGDHRFRPDLIVHRRGTDEGNLLVVEWKENAADPVLQELVDRVQTLMRPDTHPGYGYKLGVLVDSRDDHIRWRTVNHGSPEYKWQRVPSPYLQPEPAGSDAPRAAHRRMREPQFRQQQLDGLRAPHVAPVNALVDEL